MLNLYEVMNQGKDCAKTVYRISSFLNTTAKNNKILASRIQLLIKQSCMSKGIYARNARMGQY